MWLAIFWWVLRIVGPYVMEMIIDWIVGELSGMVQGPMPSAVKAESKNYKRIKKILMNEAEREARLAFMRAEVAKRKRLALS